MDPVLVGRGLTKLPVKLTGEKVAGLCFQIMFGDGAGVTQSVMDRVAQLQSGPVRWSVMRAEWGPTDRGVQLRRLMRW